MNPLAQRGRPFVLAVAGGGSEVLGKLLRHGGMSQVLLRGHVLQDTGATDAYIGRKPDKYVACRTARQLAMRAYEEARRLRPDDPHAFGVGSTSSLVKPGGEREGRPHEAFIAAQNRDRTLSYHVGFASTRSRESEETLVAGLIDALARWGARLFADPAALLGPADVRDLLWHDASEAEEELVHGRLNFQCKGEVPRYLLPSSCDPLHAGHIAMMGYAAGKFGEKVGVELCVYNADKPPLDYIEIARRKLEVRGTLEGLPYAGGLVLTSLPTFAAKAAAMPGTTFLVGADTILRVADPRFYTGDFQETLKGFARHGARFLVFPREEVEFDPDSLPYYLCERCDFVKDFVPPAISSTEVRRR